MAPDLGRRLLAEPIGTALFVVFGAGAVVAALRLGNGKLDHAGLVYDFVARPGREEAPAAAAAEQGTAGVVEGRRVAPGEGVPVGAREDSPRTGRFQGTGGDVEGRRD